MYVGNRLQMAVVVTSKNYVGITKISLLKISPPGPDDQIINPISIHIPRATDRLTLVTRIDTIQYEAVTAIQR